MARSKPPPDHTDQDHDILPPRPAYNDPTLSPQDFLMAVVHCDTLPMASRIDAAKAVAVYMHPRLAQVTQDVTAGITIRIEGGLPTLPGTNIIMPEHGAPTHPGQPLSPATPAAPSGEGSGGAE